jgi:hypothetical protein
MKSKLLSKLLIPSWLTLLVSISCLYFSLQYHAQSADTEAKFVKLQNSIELIECPNLNKDVLLSIAHTSVTYQQQIANILKDFAVFLFFVSVANVALITRHQKLSQ